MEGGAENFIAIPVEYDGENGCGLLVNFVISGVDYDEFAGVSRGAYQQKRMVDAVGLEDVEVDGRIGFRIVLVVFPQRVQAMRGSTDAADSGKEIGDLIIGFIQITLPEALPARIRLTSAWSRLTDLASLSTSSTVFGVSTGGAAAITASSARPTLVPLPHTPDVRT